MQNELKGVYVLSMWSYHLDLMLFSFLRRHHVNKKMLEILLYRYCSKQNRYTFRRDFENRITKGSSIQHQWWYWWGGVLLWHYRDKIEHTFIRTSYINYHFLPVLTKTFTSVSTWTNSLWALQVYVSLSSAVKLFIFSCPLSTCVRPSGMCPLQRDHVILGTGCPSAEQFNVTDCPR